MIMSGLVKSQEQFQITGLGLTNRGITDLNEEVLKSGCHHCLSRGMLL